MINLLSDMPVESVSSNDRVVPGAGESSGFASSTELGPQLLDQTAQFRAILDHSQSQLSFGLSAEAGHGLANETGANGADPTMSLADAHYAAEGIAIGKSAPPYGISLPVNGVAGGSMDVPSAPATAPQHPGHSEAAKEHARAVPEGSFFAPRAKADTAGPLAELPAQRPDSKLSKGAPLPSGETGGATKQSLPDAPSAAQPEVERPASKDAAIRTGLEHKAVPVTEMGSNSKASANAVGAERVPENLAGSTGLERLVPKHADPAQVQPRTGSPTRGDAVPPPRTTASDPAVPVAAVSTGKPTGPAKDAGQLSAVSQPPPLATVLPQRAVQISELPAPSRAAEHAMTRDAAALNPKPVDSTSADLARTAERVLERPADPLSEPRLNNERGTVERGADLVSRTSAVSNSSAPVTTTADAAAPQAQSSAQLQPQVAATATPSGGVPNPDARIDARLTPQIETAIEQLSDMREAGRKLRPELSLRHAEFGAVNVRLEATGGDLRATLSARDPAFAPAIQAALAERMIAPGSEATSSQSQRGHDQSGSGSNSQAGAQNQYGGQTGAQSDARYGSSTGSGQASSQPYSEQTGASDEEVADGSRADQAGQVHQGAQSGGLFA